MTFRSRSSRPALLLSTLLATVPAFAQYGQVDVDARIQVGGQVSDDADEREDYDRRDDQDQWTDDDQGAPADDGQYDPSGSDDGYAYDQPDNYDGYAPDQIPPEQEAPAVEDFHQVLSPYGNWIEVSGVGMVWRPYATVVGADFRPYASGGHWVYTDYGWSFASDYQWGWAPFHYGRWFFHQGEGWLWAPGRTWAPAWVDWRFGGGYVGWAPLPPRGFTVTVGYPGWCFVDSPRFVDVNVGRALLPRSRVHSAFGATTAIRNPMHYGTARFNAGPRPVHIATAVGHSIQPIAMRPPPPGHLAAAQMARQPHPAQMHRAPESSPGMRPAGYGNRYSQPAVRGSAHANLPPPSGTRGGWHQGSMPSNSQTASRAPSAPPPPPTRSQPTRMAPPPGYHRADPRR